MADENLTEPTEVPDTNTESNQIANVCMLLQVPAIQESIQRVLSLWEMYAEAKLSIAKGTTKSALWWAAGLISLIVVPVSVLTGLGTLDGQAATFLFGAILGATFTFLRTFLVRSE